MIHLAPLSLADYEADVLPDHMVLGRYRAYVRRARISNATVYLGHGDTVEEAVRAGLNQAGGYNVHVRMVEEPPMPQRRGPTEQAASYYRHLVMMIDGEKTVLTYDRYRAAEGTSTCHQGAKDRTPS